MIRFPCKPIAKQSKKMIERLDKYAERRRVFLNDRPVCEVCKRNKPKDVHHKQGRTGALLLDESKWLAVCRPCHNRITVDSKWAIENGYSLNRNV